MKKTLLKFVLAIPFCALAQQKNLAQTKSAAKENEPLAFKSPISFQIQGGTQGIGADVRYGVFKKLSVRAGASFIPVKRDNILTLPGFQSTNSASVSFYNVHLLADYVPFKGARGFRLVGGAAYLYKAQGELIVIPTRGNYTYGNTTVSSADIGNLNMNVSWKGVTPYVGIGLFKSFPNHFFNINLDLGTYYLSQPQTHIIGTGLLTDNSQLESQFNNNLKDYRWLPVVQLNFNFRLK